MGRRKGKPCYYCDSSSNSAEHAPPQQMFKGFECDSITVPSCDKHNSAKGGNDQAIVSALLIPLANSIDYFSYEKDIITAIEMGRSSFDRAKRKALNVPLLINPPQSISNLPNVSYIPPSVNIRDWVRLLTAALIYKATGRRDSNIDWDKVIPWSPDRIIKPDASPLSLDHVLATLSKNRDVNEQMENLSWLRGWSAHPRPYPAIIYHFELYFSQNEIGFKHVFYNRYRWYVMNIEAEAFTINRLRLASEMGRVP